MSETSFSAYVRASQKFDYFIEGVELMPATLNRPRIRRSGAPTDRAIRTEKEYDAAVAEIDSLLDSDPKKGTADFNRLELLSILVEAYEEANVTMPQDSSPQEVIAFLLDQHGMTQADLQKRLGGKGRVSEFFNHKRPLSKSQMLALKEIFHIPLDLLVS